MSSFKLPFTPIESRARTHALLSSIGFLILLPLGVLLARYARTFTSRWWWAHGLIQFVVSGPVILAGWAYGYQTTQRLFTGGNWVDTHKKIGLALLVLYLFQVFFGLFVHFLKFPRFARTPLHRPPQNYLHAILGLAILALAAYQVHYGLYTEWPRSTGGLHAVTQEAKHAWLALIIVFWALYALGLLLLRRQWKQESAFAAGAVTKDQESKTGLHDASGTEASAAAQ